MVDVAAPVDVVEAGVDARAPIPAGQCGDTYRHLRTDIACEPKHPASATWVQACETARANGFTFQLRCLNLATTKGAVAKCGATCLP